MKDLTSKLSIPSAEMELALEPGVTPMGYQVGGVSAFNNSFKRGYGDKVWGVDDRGMWLGAADFVDAPLKFYMNGTIEITASDGSGNKLVIDGINLRIVLYIAGVAQAIWGYLVGKF